MDADLYQKVLTDGACVDLTSRAKWTLSGADRVRYLNGQVTNDVRRVSATEALYACVTNVKGKIEGDLFIHAAPAGESLLLDAEPGLREGLGVRLERYIIADDAELLDVTEGWLLWHVFGPLAPGAWRMEVEEAGGHVVEATRFAVPGIDLWLPADAAQAGPISALLHTAHPLLPAGDVEDLRILQRVPRYPHELNGDVFPPEAGLEKRGMSFTKGCYIGQEILSRIKTTGKMPRVLVGWRAETAPGAAIDPGNTLFQADEGGVAKAVGVVTSVTRDPTLGTLTGLAMVRQGAAGSDSVLLVGDDLPRIDASIKTFLLVHP